MRRSYDKEFKLNAIKFLNESGKKLREVEDELGIGNGCLSHWRKEFEECEKSAFPGNGNINDAHKELVQLKRENAILKEERDILKKAMGIFTQGSKLNSNS